MITRLAHVTILVRDQEEALGWYTEKLGFEKRSDATFGPGARWLTVAPKGQKELEIVLRKPDPALHGEKRAETLMARIGQATTWVLDTDDCHKTYETLRSRGVKFLGPPHEESYGIVALFEDLYGNVFDLIERR